MRSHIGNLDTEDETDFKQSLLRVGDHVDTVLDERHAVGKQRALWHK